MAAGLRRVQPTKRCDRLMAGTKGGARLSFTARTLSGERWRVIKSFDEAVGGLPPSSASGTSEITKVVSSRHDQGKQAIKSNTLWDAGE